MRWSKIKNIILLLLVIVNLALLAQVGLREWRSRRDDQETRARMVEILARNGVDYLPAEVPGTLELQGRRVTPIPFGEEQAALLVGSVSGTQFQGVQTVYTGSEGVVSVSSAGELTVEFQPGAVPSEIQALERLSRLGVALQRETSAQGGADGVRYTQLWEGTPIPGETALLTFHQDGSVHTLHLRLITGSQELLPAESTITAATALARFLDELNRGEGYVCSQVTSIYSGYTLTSGAATLTLTPAWFVETDTWSFLVDGYTGSVTAME